MTVLAIVGPTASGKSALALAVARRLGGEIVNADAMAVYVGMDIGTAKPTVAERAQVPHHLIDVWPVTHALTVAEFQERARAAIGEVAARGLAIDREVLDARIAARVDAMWSAGLVDEVRALEALGLREGLTASRALGYQQVLAFLAGECTEEQARLDTIDATRRFARRQVRWFRRDPRITWIDYDDPTAVDRAVGLLETST